MQKVESSKTYSEPEWLYSLRENSLRNFKASGSPTSKIREDWKYTNLNEVAKLNFVPRSLGLAPSSDSEKNMGIFYKVFMFDEEENKAKGKPHILDIQRAMEQDERLLKDYLNVTSFENDQNYLFWENSASFNSGYITYINSSEEYTLNLNFQTEGEGAHYIRNLIILEENASLKLVENYSSNREDMSLNHIVNEIVLKPGAHLEHIKVQDQSKTSYHLCLNRILQYNSSNYSSYLGMFGSKLARNEIHCRLLEENTSVNLNGVYIGGDSQHLDQTVSVEHGKPNSHSSQTYRGVLAGNAKGVFSGKIYVHPKAQKTKAEQSNKTILLSDKAQMNTSPQLEIFADDVECSHGAVTGELEEDFLFYLRSRGIPLKQAREMLLLSFLEEALPGNCFLKTSPTNILAESLQKNLTIYKA